jgi:hypothetical protein
LFIFRFFIGLKSIPPSAASRAERATLKPNRVFSAKRVRAGH